MSTKRFALLTALGLFVVPAPALAIDLAAAFDSITASEMHEHVSTLADDAMEGRLVGTRGGRAAAKYIERQLRPCGLQPAGEDGIYLDCDQGGRSILVVWPGSDPELRDEYIVVGAHYDHVGDGRKGHASGAIGTIHNGADDNASGVAALLEIIEALAESRIETRRSILFAFWDGEEMGMLGSNRFFKRPTVPTGAIRLAFNIDMIGRLRDGRVEVLGTRTGYGLRRLLSGQLPENVWLDFTWDLKNNSDHWPFVEHHIPVVMLHTGLHDDYHRPGDDTEKVNAAGLATVSQLLLDMIVEAANSDWLPEYRPTGRYETASMQRRLENASRRSNAFPQPADGSPPRLGIAWRTDEAEPGSVFVTHVAANSPAAQAGIAVGDRIYTINGNTFANADAFRNAIVELLNAGDSDIELLVEARGRVRTVKIPWRPAALAAESST